VLTAGSIINDFASGAGFAAASIAISGFLMQAPSALAKADDKSVRAATVVGGLVGFSLSASVIAFVLIHG